ncbi:ATP-binding protein [Prevotella copri]|uniref:ATP-binding protein n=1 Tax=Segatella copri TaxID=165179 RepID=A0AA91A4X1_9BACT|nr:ATP-binding protein [Segatella copri]MQO09186.1 ATP-binding protein [Segatella copri]
MFNERYFSNLHNMIIPLYGFNHYHSASNCEENTEGFIGRDSIIDKLSAWLDVPKGKTTYSGAYLITGYRGMGKSSFVHKAVEKLSPKPKGFLERIKRLREPKYVIVTVNVGNELLTTKELLGMVCKVAAKRFEEEFSGLKVTSLRRSRNTVAILLAWIPIFIISIILLFCYEFDILGLCWKIPKAWYVYTIGILGVLSSGWIANQILSVLWHLTKWNCLVTIGQIRRYWHYLIERIDADVTLNTETGTSFKNPIHELGMYLKFGKNVSYPIADVPEMQEMLVELLNLIDKLYGSYLHFIFIIDELDKISPKDEDSKQMPEYNTGNSFNGNSSNRSRQRALGGLLANMKYFISSSKAKFVFVAGYDMYEETLSDISNREFNIHSIFNGHINVSSFFRRTNHYSGVESMIEQYLCQLLIGGKIKAEDGKVSLRDYTDYCRTEWKKLAISKENLQTYEHILERRIVFLHNFLTYLVYMSNGSPKKLAIYIEKYVRTQERITEKIERDKVLGEGYDIHFGKETSKYYLFFDSRNVQRICFVNYLLYPMIQNLVDKSNIYNDKLLVSTSFMLSNLYKFHKSGFSMRNLEYMPELLDINKMPELRDFIGGIVEFMTQTHIDETVMNLYKYKFPMHLSEEITFYSKTSEEISYLFNFSHDELLSVKNLYIRQLGHYNNKYEAMAIASLHHTLGDIYMLEEDYELAIYEYQEALSALYRQQKRKKEFSLSSIEIEPSRMLFMVRLSLKLGLAYEKRKTYDTAYLTYAQLTEKIRKYSICKDTYDKALLFDTIRITYLAPLAKLFVKEKMDLGGFTKLDVEQAEIDFKKVIYSAKDKKSLLVIDFYTKLGDIMYYRNVSEAGGIYMPCAACRYYGKAIDTAIHDLIFDGRSVTAKANKSIVFLEILLNKDPKRNLITFGNIPLKTVTKSFVGIANCLLGCSQKSFGKDYEEKLYSFFETLNHLAEEYAQNEEMSGVKHTITVNFDSDLSCFMKSQLYYWCAAMMYEMMGEYKSAHSIYCQMLDAVQTMLPASGFKASDGILDFCKYIVIKSIQDSYKHYGHINTTEIDLFKRMLGKNLITEISLDNLSNSTDIEIVLYKYYHICFLSRRESIIMDVLKHTLSARQLGCDKIISSLVQNIQNLRFKEEANEQTLFLLMPSYRKAFVKGERNLLDTLQIIDKYLHNFNSDIIINQIGLDIFKDNSTSNADKRFQFLIYLITDSLFCLNKVTDILSPLYSTTLYTNMYIGECYEREFVWNHILIVLREVLYYMQSKDKLAFINGFQQRYKYKFDESRISYLFSHIEKFVKDCGTYKELLTKQENTGKDPVESIYDKVCPSSHRYLTSSYLIGNAVDFYHKAVEMHTCGKAYKEMMSTLYFLEDDLFNNSCYFKFATELYCLNNGYIQGKINKLEKTYYCNKALFNIDNYLNDKNYE